jgi:hypothetical protein
MNRRQFLRSMIGGVATAAAVRAFPFRVFSFPKDPYVAGLDLGEYSDYSPLLSINQARDLLSGPTFSNMLIDDFRVWDGPEGPWMAMNLIPDGALVLAEQFPAPGRFFRNGEPFRGMYIELPIKSRSAATAS